ncbi:hypothetical protein SteCoe_9860 [Stentor coeruleus]|uniref:Uncharacterized protein n=1 Tax=Stentor coeruleus TaxID=5963 RepID=A0A1R2CGX9_9CILI|nr:hypothetical protein SteCoe_9860 [Stentor coeruleus]
MSDISHIIELRRRSSYLSVNSAILRKESIESLYSSIVNSSLSIPSSSSAESINIIEIQSANQNLYNMLSARLTALMYFRECINSPSIEETSTNSLVQGSVIINQIDANSLSNQEKITIDGALKIIKDLQETYTVKLKMLEQEKTNLDELEEEETILNSKLSYLEKSLHDIIQDKEEAKVSCFCSII